MKITMKLKGVENLRKEAEKALSEEIKKLKSKTVKPPAGKIKTVPTVNTDLKVSVTPTVSPAGSLRKKR
jgi:hypothetical protein